MGKPLLEVSYSSDYDGGWANHSYKSRIQVTMMGEGQSSLTSLLLKWLLGGMGKSPLEVSYSRNY